MINRIEAAAGRFAYIAEELELELIMHDPDVWFAAAPDDDTNLHRPFGYLPSDMVHLYCSPELVVAQTQTLDDAEFSDYLDIVEVHLLNHVEYFRDPDAEARIDRETYDKWPGSLDLLTRVQMSVLDGACT